MLSLFNFGLSIKLPDKLRDYEMMVIAITLNKFVQSFCVNTCVNIIQEYNRLTVGVLYLLLLWKMPGKSPIKHIKSKQPGNVGK